MLASTNDLSPHAADMIAAGALASVVEIQADDLVNDPSVGVTYHGVAGAVAVAAGGRFVAGAFVSNRTRETRAPGRAEVALPVYVNAESDVDCGGSCAGCAAGRACAADTDCASGNCDNGIASLGTCQ